MKKYIWCVALILSACSKTPEPTPPALAPAALVAHSAEFAKAITKVADGIYVAVGYGIANSILLVGPNGCIVVDTLESMEAARQVAAQFKTLCTTGKIEALIYTHSHPDHVQGAAAFADVSTPIYAQELVGGAMDKIASELQPILTARSLRMYGYGLSDSERVNEGIGGHLDLTEATSVSILRPTKTFTKTLTDTVAGIPFELHLAVGETEDQIFVWLPDRKVLLPGDNIYKAFPNLYTIRGTSYRDPKKWAASLDAMRRLAPEILVPSHSQPIMGKDVINAVLTDYRDAVRYVYDQSIRLMNQGFMPEELQERVKLPAHLAKSPYLQEFYGKPGWSARSIFNGNLGWFDGDVANLQPLPLAERSRHMLDLAGGESAFTAKIEAAKAEPAWVLELTSHALRVNPKNERAKAARLAALKTLGEAEANPNARHFYLVNYHELNGSLTLPGMPFKPSTEMLANMPMQSFFDGMAVNLNPNQAPEATTVVRFEFSDINQNWTYVVRKGVSEVFPPEASAYAPAPDMIVAVPAQVFKEMLAKLRNPAKTLVSEFTMKQGSKLDFLQFMRQFMPVDEK